jgi:dihydrolipoamide dehydrogenase
MNKGRFNNIMLKTKTVGAEATPEGIKVLKAWTATRAKACTTSCCKPWSQS